MKLKKIGIILIICLCSIIITACNSEKEPINNQEDIKSFKIDYYLEDEIFYSTTMNNNEELFLPRYLNYPKTMYDFYIVEVEWYDGEELVNENYRLSKDTILKAKIVVCYQTYKQPEFTIPFILYSIKSKVEMPTYFYWSYYRDLKNQEFFLDIQPCKIFDSYMSEMYENDEVGIIPGDNRSIFINDTDKEIEIEELIIHAESLMYGIRSGFFENNDFIKRITIIGDIPIIERYSFSNLSNLESITIYGIVGEIEENAVNNCNNVEITIIDDLEDKYDEK